MTTPLVSVIVPVRNRRTLLRQALDALAAQTLADHEVIVIDDGSSDGSPLEAEADARAGRPVRLVRLDTGQASGAVAARRLGIAGSRARYLAFTDSDCRPLPTWLETGVAALEDGADLVQGLTRPGGVVRPLERTMWVSKEDPLYPTCNLFLRREAYDGAGGFDPGAGGRLGFRSGRGLGGLGFGEDTLLAWRIRRRGAARFVPDAIVEHHVFEVDVRDSLRRAWATGGFAALVREVPELRGWLTGGVLLGRPTRVPLYGAVLAGAAGKRRLATLLLATWAAERSAHVYRWDGDVRRGLKVVPVELAVDATQAAALVWGSLRARTLVL